MQQYRFKTNITSKKINIQINWEFRIAIFIILYISGTFLAFLHYCY